MSDAVIQVQGLVKRFGALTAVDGVSFAVERGEIFGILGPNGAGKTTMLECIEGLQKADAGNALVLGMNALEQPEKVKDRVGVQLQASAYFERLTLTEILKLFGKMYSRRVEPEKLLRNPVSVRVDNDGRMYVADYACHRIQIYKKLAEPLGPDEIAPTPRAHSLFTQF